MVSVKWQPEGCLEQTKIALLDADKLFGVETLKSSTDDAFVSAETLYLAWETFSQCLFSYNILDLHWKVNYSKWAGSSIVSQTVYKKVVLTTCDMTALALDSMETHAALPSAIIRFYDNKPLIGLKTRLWFGEMIPFSRAMLPCSIHIKWLSSVVTNNTAKNLFYPSRIFIFWNEILL